MLGRLRILAKYADDLCEVASLPFKRLKEQPALLTLLRFEVRMPGAEGTGGSSAFVGAHLRTWAGATDRRHH